jgi:cyanate permease
VAETDPVRVRRARVARLASLAQRVGYTLFLVAVVVFVVGFAVGPSETTTTVVVAALVVGSILLAPAIVAGYAVRAAERDDLEHGR